MTRQPWEIMAQIQAAYAVGDCAQIEDDVQDTAVIIPPAKARIVAVLKPSDAG